MSQKMGIVQYYVFKRPKNNLGRVVYGAELSATTTDLGVLHKGETLLINNGATKDVAISTDPEDIRNTTTLPDCKWEPIVGQPWILHSVHFGVSESLKSAKPLVISLGEDNVKICKILNHTIDVTMA